MNRLAQVQWPFVVGLGAVALIRPLLNITGLMELLGRPGGPIVVTLLISAVWLAVVVGAGLRAPLLTLVLAGIAYGVFSIVLSAVLSPILAGELAGPLTNPAAVVAVLITNALWGAIVGLLAIGVRRLAGRRG